MFVRIGPKAGPDVLEAIYLVPPSPEKRLETRALWRRPSHIFEVKYSLPTDGWYGSGGCNGNDGWDDSGGCTGNDGWDGSE